MLEFYLKCLGIDIIPLFLTSYLEVPSLLRLKDISYFCGMDYASKDIYDFKEKISRYDHSLSTALITWKLTEDKLMTLAALFHDVGTPCFSHVIDYMNKDYANQESTEEYTDIIIKSDKKLLKTLEEDNINVDDIINFKKYSVVDNERPKLCADRLDGVILTGAFWTKDINCDDIREIVDSLIIFDNEDNEKEIGFNNKNITNKIVYFSNRIDEYCHSKEDNYMMDLLANITKQGINNGYFSYEDLYILNEKEIFNIFNSIDNVDIRNMLDKFYHIRKCDIEDKKMPYIKRRILRPMCNNRRI